jgi:hypothetical protein
MVSKTEFGRMISVFDVLRGEAPTIKETPFGRVGTLYSGEGLELAWISKSQEQIDPGWFEADTVDLLLVVQGLLRVEFEDDGRADLTLGPGNVLVLPARTRCRAYRWPRDAEEATVFVAAYPKHER